MQRLLQADSAILKAKFNTCGITVSTADANDLAPTQSLKTTETILIWPINPDLTAGKR